MASKAHRVLKGLVGGCAVVLLAVAVTGCFAPQYTYVANSSQNTYFKVPYSWHKISSTSLTKEVDEVEGGSSGWMAAYQSGADPTASNFLDFNTNQPFVFAEVGELTSTATSGLSYNSLRDFFIPVTSTARTDATKDDDFPLTDFKQIRDETLTPAQGVHGVRETFDYTYPEDGNVTDTFDEIALTNADQTEVYLLVLHCTSTCYSHDQTEINDVMSSFTVRSP